MQKNQESSPDRLLKMPQVLEIYPVSPASWRAGVRAGIYPASVKLGARAIAWKQSAIDKLIADAR